MRSLNSEAPYHYKVSFNMLWEIFDNYHDASAFYKRIAEQHKEPHTGRIERREVRYSKWESIV